MAETILHGPAVYIMRYYRLQLLSVVSDRVSRGRVAVWFKFTMKANVLRKKLQEISWVGDDELMLNVLRCQLTY